MKIGTLSSELRGAEMVLSGPERVEAILRVLRTFRPDMPLSAGYSLATDAELATLGEELAGMAWKGLVFAEVKSCDSALWPKPTSGIATPEPSRRAMFAWADGKLHHIGRQLLTQSSDIGAGNQCVALLEECLASRTVNFRGQRVGALICGELNILRGRNEITPVSARIGDWLRSLDILVNPTHDRMGIGGTLRAKRRWLSRRGKAYVSASNWNSQKPVQRQSGKGPAIRAQSRSAATLQSVLLDGQDVEMCRMNETEFEYRDALI
jgi:hypothetical protein